MSETATLAKTDSVKSSSMSYFGEIPAPVPLLTGAAATELLASVFGGNVPKGARRTGFNAEAPYAETLCAAAGLDWSAFLRASARVPLSLELTPAFLAAVSSSAIYPVDADTFSSKYYVQFIPSVGRVYVKYQSIIGSRLVATLDEAQQTTLFNRLVEDFKAFAKTPDYLVIQQKSHQVAQAVAAREAQASAERARITLASATTDTALQQLALMVPEGRNLLLPKKQLSKYAEIKRKLEVAGAVYSTKLQGFTFPEGVDAAEVQNELLSGNIVNPQKKYQFFASTEPVVRLMRAQLPESLAGLDVLEPEAGDGVLADMAKSLGGNVTTVEIWDQNVRKLQAKGYEPLERDFLTLTPSDIGLFDVIVANPPFTGGQDMEHFMHMTQFLRPEGQLCCVLSQSWQTSANRKACEFREYLETADVDINSLPAGTFKESGTSVGAVLVTLRAPALSALPRTADQAVAA